MRLREAGFRALIVRQEAARANHPSADTGVGRCAYQACVFVRLVLPFAGLAAVFPAVVLLSVAIIADEIAAPQLSTENARFPGFDERATHWPINAFRCASNPGDD